MAISVAGVGSGLDVASIVQQLMAVERQPLARLDAQKTSYNAKLSAFGQLKSALSKLQDAAATLAKASTFSATTSNVGDTKAFTAKSTSDAQTGSYSIEVGQLARAQRTATSATTVPDVSAGGKLTVTLASGGSKEIDFSIGGSLADLRNAINAADAGVSAQIVNNGSVDQLVISSKASGATNTFRLDGTGALADFSFDPAAPAGDMVSVQTAQDATLKIDGLSITRSSNTISDAIEGVTLNLVKPTDGEATIAVSRDDETAKKAIDEFAKAYNELNSLIRSQTNYDAASRKAGTLNGDSSVRSIQGQVRSVFANPISGLDGAKMLSEIGLSFKADGSMVVDSARIGEALANPAMKVAELFGGNGTVDGFAKTLESTVKSILDSKGLIASRTEGIDRSIKALEGRREALEARLAKIEARYSAQFSALDASMASMNSTSAFLAQQLGNL